MVIDCADKNYSYWNGSESCPNADLELAPLLEC